MNLLKFWNWLVDPPALSTIETSPDSLPPGSSENFEDPWLKLYSELKEANALDFLNELGDSVHKAFYKMGKKSKNDFTGWLLLVSVEKMMNERKELCDKIERLQTQVNDLKVAKCVLEENLLSCSNRAQVAENQTETLIVRLAELQRKFKSQPQSVSTVKVRALIGKEWDPTTWDGDVWEDHVEAENFESSDSQGFAPPEEVVPSAPPLEIMPSPHEEINFAESAHGPPIVSSRPVTRLKAKQAPRGEVESVVHEEIRYTTKELNEFANSFKQKPGEYVWEWILRVWDKGGRNIKLEQAEFIDMGPLSRDSRFNTEARIVKKGVKSLFEWLAEVFIKRWPTGNDLEMPDIPWLSVDEGILRLREIAMLEWIYCVKHNCPQWEGPEDMPFTSSIRRKLVRGAPAHLKGFVLSLFLVPDLSIGDASAQLDELNSLGLVGFRGNKGQVAALNRPRQGDSSYYNGQRRQKNVYNNIPSNGQHRRGEIYNGMTRLDLWYWLTNHGVSRNEIHRKPTAYLFDLYKQKNSQTNERKATLDRGKQPNERKATLDRGKQQSRPVNQFPDLRQFADPEPLE
ncbi:unnamed protein product [Trypanosoma congolense IL3000]|uniref:WGS project CAEQ00000000 data, annotated contig 1637 n=3 Tax=Eukaryota TaxID=2759 RepID=F9W7P4_TRYCI|nr:unnamed protein product [Trypanosoma congolense IL3000]